MPNAASPDTTELTTSDQLLLLDDEAFVRAAYPVVLGREVDASGLNSFVRQLRQGVSKEQVLVTLAGSDEARARGGAGPLLAGILAMHAPRPRCSLCRAVRRLLADALEPLLEQLRAIDNRLYRMEKAASERAGAPAMVAAAGAPAAPPPRVFELGDGSADQVFSAIRAWVRSSPEAAMLAQKPDAAAVASHGR